MLTCSLAGCGPHASGAGLSPAAHAPGTRLNSCARAQLGPPTHPPLATLLSSHTWGHARHASTTSRYAWVTRQRPPPCCRCGRERTWKTCSPEQVRADMGCGARGASARRRPAWWAVAPACCPLPATALWLLTAAPCGCPAARSLWLLPADWGAQERSAPHSAAPANLRWAQATRRWRPLVTAGCLWRSMWRTQGEPCIA